MSADAVAQDQIKAFFERWQRLEEEKSAISSDLKELFAEAKGNGFDTKVLRVVFRDKTKDQTERSEFEAVYDLYWSALGTPIATGAHPAPSEDHYPDLGNMVTVYDAETGEIIETHERASTDDKASQKAGPQAEAFQSQDTGVWTLADREARIEGEAVSAVLPTHSNPAEVPPLPSAVGGDDRRAESSPAAPVVSSNTITFHDPATHFLNSKGLTRLHGCQGPEACASSQPRVKLCFACSVAHDGPFVRVGSA